MRYLLCLLPPSQRNKQVQWCVVVSLSRLVRSLSQTSTVSETPSFNLEGRTTTINFGGHNSVEGPTDMIVEDSKAIWTHHVEFMMDLEKKTFSKESPIL